MVLLLSGAMLTIITIQGAAQTEKDQSLKEPLKYYCGKGEVVSLDEDRMAAAIKHERIEGFMEAMTMRFKAEDSHVLKDISPGDRVRFTLKDTPSRTRLVYIERIDEKK